MSSITIGVPIFVLLVCLSSVLECEHYSVRAVRAVYLRLIVDYILSSFLKKIILETMNVSLIYLESLESHFFGRASPDLKKS